MRRKRELNMPWTPAQHRLFEAAAHDTKVAARKGIPQQQAAKMAGEGIKIADRPKKLAAHLKRMG